MAAKTETKVRIKVNQGIDNPVFLSSQIPNNTPPAIVAAIWVAMAVYFKNDWFL
jgi:hypothetical protein